METTLEVTPCEFDDVLPWLVQVTKPKSDTSGGLASVRDVCHKSQAFRVECKGHTVGAYAVQPVEFEHGLCFWISAGVGAAEGIDLTGSMARVWEHQAKQLGAKQLGTITRRRGLMRKLQRAGWEIAGVKMVKKL